MTRLLTTLCIAIACLAGWTGAPGAVPLAEREDAPQPAVARTLTLEAVELVGAVKTTPGTVARYLDLSPGDAVTQDGLWVAVDRLRRSGLFESVDHYTRAGSQRGHLILVLEVEERGVQWRFGTGNSTMDGWYVIPAELNLDNWNGHGEQMGLRFTAGYRLL